MRGLNILILAANRDDPLDMASYPTCLEEIDGVSLLEGIITKTSGLANINYSYAFLKDDMERFHMHQICELLTPGCLTVKILKSCQGAACTALYSACQLAQDSELLILSANELVNIDYHEVLSSFRSRELDAGTITFSSVHPRYSYVRLDNELVVEAAQFRPISKEATVGIFWFKSTNLFVEAVKKQIIKDSGSLEQYYVAPCLNELILDQCKVGAFKISNSDYVQFKKNRFFTVEEN